MSTSIEISRPLDLSGPLALGAMLRIIDEVERHVHPYETTTLSLGLEAVHLGGSVVVPIALESSSRPQQYECEIVIAAEGAADAFPRFDGTMSISPLRETGSELWLQGRYTAPLGVAGSIVDATLLHGVAAASLERFVSWVAAEILTRVSG